MSLLLNTLDSGEEEEEEEERRRRKKEKKKRKSQIHSRSLIHQTKLGFYFVFYASPPLLHLSKKAMIPFSE